MPLCQKYKNIFNQVLELNHLLEIQTPNVHAFSMDVHLLKDEDFIHSSTKESTFRITIPKLMPFVGTRGAKTLENFLFDID